MNWNILGRNWKQIKGNMKFGFGNFPRQHESVVGQNTSPAVNEPVSAKNDCLRAEVMQSRRSMLRGALALGCFLIAPITLRTAQAADTDSAAPKAAKKVSKASVKYVSSAKGKEKCSGCGNFIAESNTCKRVSGKVSPNGYCVMWMQKS